MKKRLATDLALVAVMALVCFGIGYLSSAQAQAPAAPPGSYTLTCNTIQFNGSKLAANCLTSPNGPYNYTVLQYDIANCNGNLQWAPNGCSNFAKNKKKKG